MVRYSVFFVSSVFCFCSFLNCRVSVIRNSTFIFCFIVLVFIDRLAGKIGVAEFWVRRSFVLWRI